MDQQPILEVSHLQTRFETRQGTVEAVSDVSFVIGPGETVALVGESGSGKSVTSLSILHLLEPTGSITNGTVTFDGVDITNLSEKQFRAIRGRDISMIFQDPSTCLDPVYTVENQLREVLEIHGTPASQAKDRALELLELVGMPDPHKRLRSYQHQLSGGQRQRVMIAIALAMNPKLVIADEPTTALDVTVQAQILDLLRSLQRETGSAILFVTHDLGVVAEMADKVVVMYAGQVVERGTVREVINDPKHPYTRALLNSMPGKVAGLGERLEAIEGTVPSLFDMPNGCRFAPRCKHAWDHCRSEAPPLIEGVGNRASRCWLADPTVELPLSEPGQVDGVVVSL